MDWGQDENNIRINIHINNLAEKMLLEYSGIVSKWKWIKHHNLTLKQGQGAWRSTMSENDVQNIFLYRGSVDTQESSQDF